MYKNKCKQEGIIRMEKLVKRFKLNPNLIKYLKEDKLYYSYITGNGMIGCIDTITYDSEYGKIVSDFEAKNNYYVYHAIESYMPFKGELHKTLSLLYVSKYEEDWETTKYEIEEDSTMAYVYNFTVPNLSEGGYIGIDAFKAIGSNFHVLVRTI